MQTLGEMCPDEDVVVPDPPTSSENSALVHDAAHLFNDTWFQLCKAYPTVKFDKDWLLFNSMNQENFIKRKRCPGSENQDSYLKV